MAGRSELLDHLTDQLAPLGDTRGRPMFGGYGVYLDGLIIGLIAFDAFYLKVDDQNRPDLEAAGAPPFSYDTKHGVNTTAYWEVPADVPTTRPAPRPGAEVAGGLATGGRQVQR
jgi:DNA transformation protein